MRRCFFVQPQYVLFAALAALPAATAAASAPCAVATFQALGLPETSIILVESLVAGSHPSPVGTIEAPICRVRAVFAPANLFEVWLPTSTWNGKYQGAGNGVVSPPVCGWPRPGGTTSVAGAARAAREPRAAVLSWVKPRAARRGPVRPVIPS